MEIMILVYLFLVNQVKSKYFSQRSHHYDPLENIIIVLLPILKDDLYRNTKSGIWTCLNLTLEFALKHFKGLDVIYRYVQFPMCIWW